MIIDNCKLVDSTCCSCFHHQCPESMVPLSNLLYSRHLCKEMVHQVVDIYSTCYLHILSWNMLDKCDSLLPVSLLVPCTYLDHTLRTHLWIEHLRLNYMHQPLIFWQSSSTMLFLLHMKNLQLRNLELSLYMFLDTHNQRKLRFRHLNVNVMPLKEKQRGVALVYLVVQLVLFWDASHNTK